MAMTTMADLESDIAASKLSFRVPRGGGDTLDWRRCYSIQRALLVYRGWKLRGQPILYGGA